MTFGCNIEISDIISYTLSFIFFLGTVIIYIKQKRYPCKISCDIIEKYRLYHPSKLGSHNISILLDNTSINHNLSYIKYLLVSVGNRDVQFDKHDRISFCLNTAGNWVSFDAYSICSDINAFVEIKQNTAELYLPKLRVNEAIVIEAFYESKSNDKISIKHRITNTRDVVIMETLLHPTLDEIIESWIRRITNVCLLLVLIYNSLMILPFPSNYFIKKDGSTRSYVEAIFTDINTIYVKEPGYAIGAPEPETLTYDEFAKNYIQYPRIKNMIRNSYICYVILVTSAIMFIIVRCIKPVKRYYRRKKYKSKYNDIISLANKIK